MSKLVDIDEEELRRLRSLEGTVQGMLKHPKAGVLLEQAHKHLDEKAPTPRLDAEKAREDLLADSNKRIAELEKKLETDAQAREQNQKLDALQKRETEGLARLRGEGWTDEGLAGVKKIMEEQGILDPLVAAAYFEKLHPPADPIAPGGTGSWNFFEAPADTNDDMKKLIETRGESNSLVDKMARDALKDVRGQSRR